MTYGVVRQLGGNVHITSQPGEGTRVEIHLPAINTSAPLAANAGEQHQA